jgi:predicted phage terminase large subunit-like protein
MRGQRVDLGGRTVYLDDCWRFLAIDLAASVKTSADWTVAGAFAISPDGDLILLGSIRARIEEKNHWKIIKPLYDLMKADVVYVESRMFGTTLVKDASRAGVQVQELKADSDKITRAIPASVRMENGMIWLPTVDTMSDVGVWVNELISFPNASHDDCVDVIAYAARVVAAYWLGEVDAKSRTVGNKFESSTDTEINQVFQSATGQTPNGIDFENVRW